MITKNNLKNLTQIKALIFDMDETLYLCNIKSHLKHLFGIYNCEYKDEYYKMLISAFNDTLKIAENKCGINKNTFVSSCSKFMPFEQLNIDPDNFVDNCLTLSTTYLTSIKNMYYTIFKLKYKYNLYILSNWFKHIQEIKLHRTSLHKFFNGIYTFDDYYAKPNKLSFERVLKDNNLTKDEVIMIGDSYTGVVSSEYGIQSILVDYENEKNKKNMTVATAVVTESTDLLKLFEII